MRTLISALVLTGLAISAPAFAQTVVTNPSTVRLAFDHDGIGIEGGGFKLYVDLATTGTTLVTTPATGGFTAPFPALTPGSHQLQVTAFNPDVESEKSNILAVRVVVVPASPSGFRLVMSPFARTGKATVLITAVQTADGLWHPTLSVGQGRYRKA